MDDWRRIREACGETVWKAAYRILANDNDAADCFQDVFAEAMTLADADSIRDWPAFLHWLAVRRALDRLRRRRAETDRSALDSVPGLTDPSPGPEESAQACELVGRVRDEVARLPARQAEAFWLACVEQASHAEIGERLGASPRSVAMLVLRARKRLRRTLADLDPVRLRDS